jgi:hypothetical protein
LSRYVRERLTLGKKVKSLFLLSSNVSKDLIPNNDSGN